LLFSSPRFFFFLLGSLFLLGLLLLLTVYAALFDKVGPGPYGFAVRPICFPLRAESVYASS
jgi:hypothetical protein